MSEVQRDLRADLIAAALEEHRSALRASVRRRVPPADVDDILQLAAVRAIERAHSLRAPQHVLPWLYAVHRTVLSDQHRKRARQERLASAMALEPEVVVETGVGCGCSLAQVEYLGERYAEILHLVDLGGRSPKEAAEELGLSANNASVRLHRARKALRQRLEEHCGVTSLRDCLDCRCVEEGCCAA